MARPTQPSVPKATGSHVCMMSMARKCDRLEFGYPTPCTTPTLPWSYSSLSGAAEGWNASVSSIGSASSSLTRTSGLAS